jgi:hypothetical protein
LDEQNNCDKRAHFTADLPVNNIPDFIERSGDIAFIVFRYYRCSDATRWDSGRRGRTGSEQKLFYHEGIAITSEILQNIIHSVSRCLSDETEECHEDEYSTAFFYHHRDTITCAAANVSSEAKDQTSALLDYIESTHGQYFEEMDDLITAGKIQSRNIEMLFCPNEILVTRIGGVLSACVLAAWPTGGSTISLGCWAWGYNGHWLHRKYRGLAINRPIQTTVNIRDLEVYPARFATSEEWTYLQRRGQKFWSLRYQSFVAYEGWDFKSEQYYVR